MAFGAETASRKIGSNLLRGVIELGAGEAKTIGLAGASKLKVHAASAGTLTISEVATESTSAHDATTTQELAAGDVHEVDWPFYRISSVAGAVVGIS